MDKQRAMTVFEKELLERQDVSYWLKEQIETTNQRDPIDSLTDAITLVTVLEQRCALIQSEGEL